MTKPQNAGVGDVEVNKINCQQHPVSQKKTPRPHLPKDPNHLLWMRLLPSVF